MWALGMLLSAGRLMIVSDDAAAGLGRPQPIIITSCVSVYSF